MNRYILILEKLSDMARKLYQVPEKKRTGEVILRTQGLGRSFVKNSLFGKSRSGSGGTAVF